MDNMTAQPAHFYYHRHNYYWTVADNYYWTVADNYYWTVADIRLTGHCCYYN
jgi:hypothetical protein